MQPGNFLVQISQIQQLLRPLQHPAESVLTVNSGATRQGPSQPGQAFTAVCQLLPLLLGQALRHRRINNLQKGFAPLDTAASLHQA